MNRIFKKLAIFMVVIAAAMDMHAVNSLPDVRQFDEYEEMYLIVTCRRLERGDIDSIDMKKLDECVSVYYGKADTKKLETVLCIEGLAACEKGDTAVAVKTMRKVAEIWFLMQKSIEIEKWIFLFFVIVASVLIAIACVLLIAKGKRLNKKRKSVEEQRERDERLMDAYLETLAGSSVSIGDSEKIADVAEGMFKTLDEDGQSIDRETKAMLLIMCADSDKSVDELVNLAGINKGKWYRTKKMLMEKLGISEAETNPKALRKAVIEKTFEM